MKIVFFMESYWRGGVDTFVINLINNWPEDSDELILICNRNHSGIEQIQEEIRRPCEIIKHKVTTFQWFFNKTQEVTTIDYTIKFILKTSSPILRYVFLIYNILALKGILLQSNPDRLMIINGGYPGGDSCRAAAIAWGIFSKKPYSIHNFHGVVVRSGWHIKLQEYLTDRLISRFTKNFVTVSYAAAGLISCRGGISKKHKALYIHSGVDISESNKETNPANIKREIGIPLSNQLCLMLGNYGHSNNYDKGYSFLFQAFKKVINRIPKAHLLVCGYGSYKAVNRVRRLVSKFGIQRNTHISGFRGDIPSLLRQTDVLLMPAQAFESFGLASIEAMAHHIPVVATKVGGIPEIVTDGEGGYCVEKDDVDSYADHIIRLLENDNLKKEQGQKGFQRYKILFTATRMAKEYAKLIHNG